MIFNDGAPCAKHGDAKQQVRAGVEEYIMQYGLSLGGKESSTRGGQSGKQNIVHEGFCVANSDM